MTFEEASEAGQSCFEHLTGIWRGHFNAGYEQQPGQANLNIRVLQMVNEQLDDDAIRRLGAFLAQRQLWNCPTLVCYRYMLDAEETCCANQEIQPYLCYVPQQALKTWRAIDPSRSQAPATFDPWLTALHQRNETFLRITSLLHQEGAPLLVGTDTSVRYVIQGRSVHQELELLVAAGLRPFEALRAGTSEAARFLGQENEWGTITVGKQANMLLLSANPLEDIQAASRVEAVCVNGFYLARQDLDAMLAHLEQVASSGLPQSLPRVALDDLTENGEVVAQGIWREEYMDHEAGYLAYRHCHLPDGSWLVEEHQAFEYGELFSQGGPQQRKTVLHLASDGTIQRWLETRESWLGSERREISRSEAGAYMIHCKEIDGYEQVQRLASIPLLPADTLSFTAFPLLIKNKVDVTSRQALSIDETGIHVVLLEGICEQESAQNGETQWQIRIHRPDLPVQLKMHITNDEVCQRLEQTGRINLRIFTATQEEMFPRSLKGQDTLSGSPALCVIEKRVLAKGLPRTACRNAEEAANLDDQPHRPSTPR